MPPSSPALEPTHCIACGGNDGREIADAAALRGEVEALWAFHGRRLRVETPPERLMDRVAFSQHAPVRLVRCARCGLVYRNPIERAQELDMAYADATPDESLLRALHDTQRPAYRAQARRLLAVMGRRGAGLEVGSYVGGFLAAAREEGLGFEGLDVAPHVNAFTRRLGFAVHDGDLTTFSPRRTYDAIAIWNVFDQLPDPLGAAHAAWRLLRPGGVLAVRVPNGECYAALRDAAAGGAHDPRAVAARLILVHNNLLTFPYRYGFGVPSLTRLLERVGFTVERVHGDVLVPIADEWTRPWAAIEERAVKRALRVAARVRPRRAPWIEIFVGRRE